MNPLGFLFVAVGIFSLSGACFDWDWYMNSRKARFLVAILTRTGARIFYGVLGLALIVLGILVSLKIVDVAR